MKRITHVFWIVLLRPSCFANGHQLGNDIQIAYNYAPTAFAAFISDKCFRDSKYYVESLSQGTSWALKMYESSGKLPEYIPDSNDITHHQAGWFDKCLSVESDDGRIQGQYCSVFFDDDPQSNEANASVTMNIKRPFTVMDIVPLKSHRMVGLCIPSSCNDLDLRIAVAQGFPKRNNKSVVVLTAEKYCHTKKKISDQSQLDSAAIGVLALLGVLCATVVVATFQDLRLEKSDTSHASRTLLCFSAITNTKKLLSTTPGSVDDMSCLHGIRFITAIWVVSFHTAQALLLHHIYNRKLIATQSSKWISQIFNNGSVSVDTFFLISGLLAARSFLRDLDRFHGRLNILSHYFHRYMRTTPVVAVMIAIVATLWVRLGSGPEWATIEYMAEDCQKRWWIHLLYLNNYAFNSPSMTCLPEAWFLACDMQMFWISPLIIYPLWRWKRAGLVWTISIMTASVSANFAVHLAWNLPPTFIFSRKSPLMTPSNYLTNYYVQTYLRFPPYLLGILLGWTLHQTKGSRISLRPLLVIIGWMMAVIICLLVLFGLVPYLNEDEGPDISPRIAALYGSFHRLAWATAVGWVIFACVNGYGGAINRMLSWKGYVPMGRLTFIVYLTHLNYIKTVNALAQRPIEFNPSKEVVVALGLMTMSFVLAVVIAVVVEIPFVNLERLLRTSRRST